MARGAVSTDAQTRSSSSLKIAFDEGRQRRRPWSLKIDIEIIYGATRQNGCSV